MASIVIVDDSPVNALPLSRLLQYSGHEVETLLRSGLAPDALHRHKPDLLLLDVGMPDINGIELLRILRDDPTLKDLPVIMYSAMSDPHIMEQARELGALEYLVKGGGWEALLNRIEEHLPKH
jgi:two-component system sensor histidine kinase/response regulator